LINWKTCLRSKSLGGLGIKDIEKFGRALRLRWLWNGWCSHLRQWKHLLIIQNPTDRALFFSSTYIQVGDGQNTPFWEAKWVNAVAPKEIAPNIFKHARFKKKEWWLQSYRTTTRSKTLVRLTPLLLWKDISYYILLCPQWLSLIRETKLSGVGHLMASTRQNLHTIVNSLEP
jgi:hypothetical protein